MPLPPRGFSYSAGPLTKNLEEEEEEDLLRSTWRKRTSFEAPGTNSCREILFLQVVG